MSINDVRALAGMDPFPNPPVYRLYMYLADNGYGTSRDYPEEMMFKDLLREMDIVVHMSNVVRVELVHIFFPGQENQIKYLIGELPVTSKTEQEL